MKRHIQVRIPRLPIIEYTYAVCDGCGAEDESTPGSTCCYPHDWRLTSEPLTTGLVLARSYCPACPAIKTALTGALDGALNDKVSPATPSLPSASQEGAALVVPTTTAPTCDAPIAYQSPSYRDRLAHSVAQARKATSAIERREWIEEATSQLELLCDPGSTCACGTVFNHLTGACEDCQERNERIDAMLAEREPWDTTG